MSAPNNKQEIIIVGAGIIGVCTAFYLTRHPSFDPAKHHITIIEARRPAGGASGKAGGLLALWAFPQQLVPLSFKLHQDLAEEFNGEAEWGYRRLTTVSIEGNLMKSNPAAALGRKLPMGVPRSINTFDPVNTTHDPSSTDPSDTNSNPFNYNHSTLKSGSTPFHSSPRSDSLPADSNNNSESSAASSSGPVSTSTPTSTSTSISTSKSSPAYKSSSAADTLPSSAEEISKGSSEEKEYISTKNNSFNGTHAATVNLPSDLNWIKPEIVDGWSNLGGQDSTAQVHPYKFTLFFLKKALETGAVDLIIGKVTSLNIDRDEEVAESVTYVPHANVSSVFKGGAPPSNDPITLHASKIILTTGPWTSKLIPGCPILGLRAHSITILPTKPTTPYAIFTELRLSRSRFVSPEIYARKDEIYVCGEGDTTIPVPETTDDVEIDREKCDELFDWAGKCSVQLQNGKILKRQACYLPVVDIPSCSGPFVGETNVEGLFVASGHSCWGINNAPGTGKIMAEIVLDGEATSADIDGLEPALYFDATVTEADCQVG
ncbi:FAD dependent oxidoreductase [Nadsonia fulvescens var. elongata DSM 6958]|uniref:FAD dependent oxidoreductase n=1 Tax=Nadsonia fulvescens var. elongata DSM 6958 TaxID=857566 RepID=A0A1E3PI57_9ASCO|nr:FAD dependent oxidoreductase [Nadsonia fulvescens var. elongata DSM 6958]